MTHLETIASDADLAVAGAQKQEMHIRQPIQRIFAVAGAITALLLYSDLASAEFLSSGSGRVLNASTRQPVADAEVSLDCQRDTNIESSERLKLVKVKSDENGNYSFSADDVAECSFGFVSVAKQGYMDAERIEGGTRLRNIDYNHIPKLRILVPESDVTMVRLVQLNPWPKSYDPRYSPTDPRAPEKEVQEYERVFSAFYDSEWLAQSPEEKSFVVSHYCKRLEDLYPKLSDADKAMFTRRMILAHVNLGQVSHPAPMDFANEVESYCSSGGTRPHPFT